MPTDVVKPAAPMALLNFGDIGRPDDDHEPLIAWRGWQLNITKQGPWLTSVTYSAVIWPGMKPLAAECKRSHGGSCGSAPQVACHCGIYALRECGYLGEKWFHQPASTHWDKWRIIGRVSLWGKIVVHETGFRAERAYPYELIIPEEVRSHVHELTRRYCVDVKVIPRQTP